MAYIKRNIEKLILELAKQRPVIMLTGARQVGKSTTLINLLGKKVNFVTLDNMDDRRLAVTDPKLFLEKYKYPLIIDEFQYAPELLSYIKMIVDENRFKKFTDDKVKTTGLYFLTGSQRWLSMKNIRESLAGRVSILDMYGLSTREINGDDFRIFDGDINKLKKEKIKSTKLNIKKIFERIYKGSFPELYNTNIDRERFYASYIETYIKRDIKELLGIKNEIAFYNLLVVLAARTGCELNIAEVSNEINVNQVTTKEWINVLYGSGIITLIEPFSHNIIKRVVKRPKIYFMDTGLVAYLLKYPNAEILENSNLSGQIFETYVVTEIIKSICSNGHPLNDLYYYRDNNRQEIDLVYLTGRKLHPIEIKKTKAPQHEVIKNFKVLENNEYELCEGYVVCNIDDIYPLSNNNYCIPAWLI